jgi:phage FluMu protein Com
MNIENNFSKVENSGTLIVKCPRCNLTVGYFTSKFSPEKLDEILQSHQNIECRYNKPSEK